MTMSKALVTGGAGFIGSHLCDRLVAQGLDVVVIDDFSLGRRENLAHLQDEIEIIDGSVLGLRDYAHRLEGVEVIYHLAALISGYDSLHSPDEYLDVNMKGLFRIIELARDLGRPRIVFASSSTVYGDQRSSPYAEDDPVSPPTVYALTKYSGEQTLALYAELYNLDYVCLRLFNVYGPRQNPDHPYANVTCKFAHAAATHGRIARYGDGLQCRDFVHVDDVVEAMWRVTPGANSPVYNVGTGQTSTINELIELTQSLADGPLYVDQQPPWPNDIRTIRADTTRLTREFGFRPHIGLPQGLAQTVSYFAPGGHR